MAILILVWASSSPAFPMMHSACKLSKQGDNIQSWRIPFPIWNQSVLWLVLTVSSWPAYGFLRRQVRWYAIPISLRFFHSFFVIHTVKGFSIVNEAEVGVFWNSLAFSMIQWMMEGSKIRLWWRGRFILKANKKKSTKHDEKEDNVPEASEKYFLRKEISFVLNDASVFYWRRQWQPTPVLLPGKPYGRRSLVGCSPWSR